MAYTRRHKIRIDGAAELEKKLKELGTKTAAKILRKATRAAAKPILKATKANTPVHTGNLKRAFTVRAMRRMKKGFFGVKVTSARKGPHAHLIELGTKERFRKDGKSTGSVKPRHFMDRAFQETKTVALATFIKITQQEIANASR